MTRNLIIAHLVLLIGLSGIYLLPKTYGVRESAIIMSLPTNMEGWRFRESSPSQLVLDSLADDTDYEQGEFTRPATGRLGKYDMVSAFIVLSGDDMNNSIHRPERCLVAQGFEILESESVEINAGLNSTFKTRRLVSRHTKSDITRVSYYWFTGAAVVTPSHYGRTLTDMLDRLTTGTNQRWAYVTVSGTPIEESSDHQLAGKTIEETDSMLVEFISGVFPHIHKTDQLRGDWQPAASE